MNDDASLLRAYADQKSEAAFAELVRRHIDLVYGAALRRTGGDVHAAADVAQQVFVQLARHARKLARHTVLAGWLHAATRNAAFNLMISDQRRKAREAAAVALQSAGEASPDWERLRPLLDGAIDELPEADRSAVVLRFLERRPFAEIGAALRVSEDAARMRVERALEKLRAGLARQGVTSTGAALAAVFANQVGAMAPGGLAGRIAGVALAGAAATTGFFMSTTTAIVSAVALAAVGSTAYEWNRAFRAEAELSTLSADRDGLRAQLSTEQQRNSRSASDLAALRAEVDTLKAKQASSLDASRVAPPASTPPSTESRAEKPAPARSPESSISQHKVVLSVLNNLRQLSSARDQFLLEHGRLPTSLNDLVGPTGYVLRINPIDGENYTGISLKPGQPMTVTTASGVAVTYDPDGNTTTKIATPSPEDASIKRFGPRTGAAFNRAMEAFRTASGGASPETPQSLLPYFATPQEAADFLQALEAQKPSSIGK